MKSRVIAAVWGQVFFNTSQGWGIVKPRVIAAEWGKVFPRLIAAVLGQLSLLMGD